MSQDIAGGTPMRRLKISVVIVAIVCASALGFPTATRADDIVYEAIDLPDVTPGQDLWRYNYFVSGFSFQANQAINIVFDRSLYSGLEDPPPPVNANWNVFVLQPDLMLPDDGSYNALALVNAPSLDNIFSVSFVYLGSGTPGSQFFNIIQFNPQGGFVGILQSGNTSPVPEPGTVLLLLSGLIGLAGSIAKSRHPKM